MRVKKPFFVEIHEIIKKFGYIVSRKDLVGYCTEHGITSQRFSTLIDMEEDF